MNELTGPIREEIDELVRQVEELVGLLELDETGYVDGKARAVVGVVLHETGGDLEASLVITVVEVALRLVQEQLVVRESHLAELGGDEHLLGLVVLLQLHRVEEVDELGLVARLLLVLFGLGDLAEIAVAVLCEGKGVDETPLLLRGEHLVLDDGGKGLGAEDVDLEGFLVGFNGQTPVV